ncbi:YetF domain-containing protein [Candidatus Contubernalis alkaliaceticus]|uniref:YetF domain-containing protein n=1 Tax=Candidatus Contubernalis alkaliaceticus TaxID=338645 RepID=UPI001F4C0A7E|nr:DUF421 domain-containing protein [Candidatus Contubernalis alkalaceticus]UNC92685.1 DUF421 domain-containing protein [Candidatus Contubernalis alkalaceticus]
MAFQVVMRTVVFYVTVLIVIRLLGKREVGQLSSFDLVVAIMIAELAAIPMDKIEIPIYVGILPILTLAILEVMLAGVSLKSKIARSVINGVPSVLIENGNILEGELRKLRYNINDLLRQLREKDVFNISDVEFAILETSGKISVVLKSQSRPVIPKDLNLRPSYEGLSHPLIIDGNVNTDNLKKVKLDSQWLKDELKKNNVNDFKEVLLATIDSQGNLYVSKKEKS